MRKAVLSLLRATLFLSLVLPAASQAQDKQQSGQQALDPPSWSSWKPYEPPAEADTIRWRSTLEGARHPSDLTKREYLAELINVLTRRERFVGRYEEALAYAELAL